ncbi:MAG TPA: ATP synthase F1 subunit delta [Planctomycetota bacterium]|jgi:F-type H+-transporting ATPase subunit delta
MAAQQSSVAFIYAEALYGVALEDGNVMQVEEELLALADLIRKDPQVHLFLETPTIAFSEKRKVLESALAQFSQPLRNFLYLVIQRERVSQIEGMVDAFHERANEGAGIAEFDVKSARELLPDEAEQLKELLNGRFKRKISLRTGVEPKLLGGLVLHHKGWQWDTSLAHRLQRLVHSMEASKNTTANVTE